MQPHNKIASGSVISCIAAALLLSLCSLTLAAPASNADAAWLQQVAQYRTELAAELTRPDGWLSLVGLAWIHPGDNSLGSAADNRIRLDKLPAHLGVLHLDANGVTLLPAPQSLLDRLLHGSFPPQLLLNGKPAPAAGGRLAEDEEHPALQFNTLSMYVIQRGDRTYLRVKDSQSPTLRRFHGLNWYAPDPHYRIRARWLPENPPEKINITDAVGVVLHLESPGTAVFTLNGRTVRLHPVVEDSTEPVLFFVFRDATSGNTTYGAGRFLYTDFPDHGLNKPGTVLLDFNLAVNPPCAFTPYATCPLPPPQNRFNVAIPAGEKRYQEQ